MSESDGVRRRDAPQLHPADDPLPPKAAAQARANVANAPWAVDVDRLPAGGPPPLAVFSNPAMRGPNVALAAPPRTGAPSGASPTEMDRAWAAAGGAPLPAAPTTRPANAACPNGPALADPRNAKSLADRGVPLGLAIQRSTIVTVAELERFIDDYLEHTASRPDLKGLHADAARSAPVIFARRLEAEAAEQERLSEEVRLANRVGPLQLRAPLPIQQRAVAGEVAIPIARAVDGIAKLVPVVGELVVAVEAASGKSCLGLGEDIERSERIVSAALLLAPFATAALGKGVRYAAELHRLAQATGRTTTEARSILVAARTIEANQAEIRAGMAAAKAGRPLTQAQSEAIATANRALGEIKGAAAISIFDVRSRANLPVRSFADNANGAVRSVEEARAIARSHGVEIPSWIRIEVDPKIREGVAFAEYSLARDARETTILSWDRLAPPEVVVRVHPSVLRSDEKIVGVFQHEVWELTQLRARVDARKGLSAAEIQRLVDPTASANLHGQAWDISDLRVLLMRESDPAKKADLAARLERMINKYTDNNLR